MKSNSNKRIDLNVDRNLGYVLIQFKEWVRTHSDHKNYTQCNELLDNNNNYGFSTLCEKIEDLTEFQIKFTNKWW